MPIISLAALTVLDAGPIGHLAAAAEAGFTHAGLRLQPLVATDQRIVGDAEETHKLESLLASTGVKPLEIGVFPISSDIDIDAYAAVLSFSHKIGAQFVTCPVEDADKARRVESFRRMCDLAMSCGLEALIEFNPYSGCRSLAEAAELVAQTKRENARLLIDVLHLARSGGSPADLAAIDPSLIALVHLCDARPPRAGLVGEEELRQESRTARLYPGEGSLWLDELLDALPPETPLSIEAPSAAHAHLAAADRARAAMAATRRLLEKRGQN